LRLFENDADLGSDFRLYQRTLLETARQLQLSSDGRDVLSWLIANSDNDGWIRGITITSWAAELGIDRRKLSAELHSLNGRGVVQLVSVRGHGIDIALSTTTKALLVSTLMYLRKYQNGTYANPQVQKPYLRKYQNGTYDQGQCEQVPKRNLRPGQTSLGGGGLTPPTTTQIGEVVEAVLKRLPEPVQSQLGRPSAHAAMAHLSETVCELLGELCPEIVVSALADGWPNQITNPAGFLIGRCKKTLSNIEELAKVSPEDISVKAEPNWIKYVRFQARQVNGGVWSAKEAHDAIEARFGDSPELAQALEALDSQLMKVTS
jgi:hypothetical protein